MQLLNCWEMLDFHYISSSNKMTFPVCANLRVKLQFVPLPKDLGKKIWNFRFRQQNLSPRAVQWQAHIPWKKTLLIYKPTEISIMSDGVLSTWWCREVAAGPNLVLLGHYFLIFMKHLFLSQGLQVPLLDPDKVRANLDNSFLGWGRLPGVWATRPRQFAHQAGKGVKDAKNV